MRKKLLKAVLAAAMLVSLTACGGKEPSEIKTIKITPATTISYNDSEEITTFSDTSAEGLKTTKTLPTESETTTSEAVIYPKNYDGIDVGDFSEGMAFIETGGEKKGGRKMLIDSKGNIVFEFGSSWDNIKFLPEKISNGSFVYGSEKYADSEGNKMFYLIDIEGNILRSSKYDGYTGFIAMDNYVTNESHLYKVDGFIIAYKIVKKYDGYEYQLGVLNDAGEWVVPLSADLEFFSLPDVNYADVFEGISCWRYLGNNIVAFSCEESLYHDTWCCYNFIEDKIIAAKLPYEPWGIGNTSITMGPHDRSSDEIRLYNIETKEVKETEKYYECTPLKNVFLAVDRDGMGSLRNYDGEILIDFGTKFKFNYFTNNACYQDGYLITNIKDDLDEEYILCVDSKGELAFEPINFDSHYSSYSFNLYNNVLYYVDDKKVIQYNLKGELLKTTKLDGEWNYLKVYPEHEIIVAYDTGYYTDDSDTCYIYDFDGNIIAM